MEMPKTIIITACDDRYAVLANDLFASIKSCTFHYSFDLGLLDVGLTEPLRAHFSGQNVRVEKVRTDIDYPMRAAFEAQRPGGIRTLTARPFLRSYFPGYDIYIWLDADVWVQTPDAVNWMIRSVSTSPGIHLCPELDRCYQQFFMPSNIWYTYNDWYKVNYGEEVAKSMQLMPMLNAGVWAMAHDSPVWHAWRQIYTEALLRMTELNDKSFMADQLGLNILLYAHGMPCVIMPSHFNWLTYFAVPMFDRSNGAYVEPSLPFRALSQIHLTHSVKLGPVKVKCLDGTVLERPLLFSTRAL